MKKCACILLSLLLGVFCVMPVAAEKEGEAPYLVTCCINGDAGSCRGFNWFTKSKTETVIHIFENENDITSSLELCDIGCEEWKGAYRHKLVVKGLKPGTLYSYQVGDGTASSTMGTFVTDDGDDAFTFINIADVQAGSAERFQQGADTLQAAFETVPDAEFVLNCGDFTNDCTEQEWQWYADSFDSLNARASMVPVVGNHDGFGSASRWFEKLFCLDTSESVEVYDGVNYSFDYGNAHIAVLNSNDLLNLSNLQLKWLKNDLNRTNADWKIVALHKSPYTLGKDGKWPDALYLQKSLTKVLDACDVDICLSGHDHMYLRTKALKNNKIDENGTVYVLSGTAGYKRYEVRSFLVDSFMKKEFIDALTIQKDGYGNYWNGENWDSVDENRIGGCFSKLSISGGKLTLNAYILSDEGKKVTCVDTLELTKQTGLNKASFSGDNTTTKAEYVFGVLPSFTRFAFYTFFNWLPKFLGISPKIIKSVVKDDIF